MQPSANMKPRALLTKSAPQASAQAARAEVTSCPAAMILTLSLIPASIRASTTRGRASSIDSDMWSASACGAAPEPPSPPSTAMKSGASPTPRRATASVSRFMNCQPPMAVLIPTGLPVTSRTRNTMSSSWSMLVISGWRFGESESRPSGMPRIRAISGVTLPPGSTPPLPGLAPCESLISKARTDSWAAISRSFASDRRPSASRTPYFAVPICMITSQPPSR